MKNQWVEGNITDKGGWTGKGNWFGNVLFWYLISQFTLLVVVLQLEGNVFQSLTFACVSWGSVQST